MDPFMTLSFEGVQWNSIDRTREDAPLQAIDDSTPLWPAVKVRDHRRMPVSLTEPRVG
jgi:hypothetical protein